MQEIKMQSTHESKRFGTGTEIFCKVIRILALAPVLALIGLTVLYVVNPFVFSDGGADGAGLRNYLFTVLFLTVFPLLAYPIQPLVPGFRGKGREGQRNLAIVMAVLGYIGAVVYAFCARAPLGLRIVATAYLLSGVWVMLFNKVFHIRASGHGCGIAGPISYLLYFCGPFALLGIPFAALVFWSSVKMKRHTVSQLVIGAALAVVSVILSVLMIS